MSRQWRQTNPKHIYSVILTLHGFVPAYIGYICLRWFESHLIFFPQLFNTHFSSIIQHSWMETKCSSCPWIISEFASHQHCFCVVKICGHCVHTNHKKVRSAGKVSCSSQGWTRTNFLFIYFLGRGTARSSNQAPNNAIDTKQKAHKQE